MPETVTIQLPEELVLAALRQLPPDRRQRLLRQLSDEEGIVAKPISAHELANWRDLIAVGGDALVDSERLYDE